MYEIPTAVFDIKKLIEEEFTVSNSSTILISSEEINQKISNGRYENWYIKKILEDFFNVEKDNDKYIFKKNDSTEKMVVASNRIRKSEKLSPDERKRFSKVLKSFDTKIDCAESLQITRQTLDAILLKGHGAPSTISKIKKILNEK